VGHVVIKVTVLAHCADRFADYPFTHLTA
jgi:hypothetical protein